MASRVQCCSALCDFVWIKTSSILCATVRYKLELWKVRLNRLGLNRAIAVSSPVGLAIFLIHMGHSCYILSTFEVFLIIETAFCLNSWTLEPYSAVIPGAFWLHSYKSTFQLDFRRYSGSNRTALIWHSKCILNIMTAFWIVNIPIVFQLHASCIRELMPAIQRQRSCMRLEDVARVVK